MVDRPTEALTVIPQYNLNPYNESTNPYGFDDGGHIYNHLQSFRYVVQIENWINGLALQVDADATQTAADRVQTGQDRQAAADSAAAAATFNPALYARRDGVNFTGAVTLSPAAFLSVASSDDARYSWSFDVDQLRAGFYWNAELGLGSAGYKFTVDREGRVWTAETGDLRTFIRAGGTQTDLLTTFAGSTQRAGVNVSPRGSSPAAPANGDLWSLATGLWGYFGGITRQLYDTTSLPPPTNPEIDAGTNTLRKAWSVLDVWRAVRAVIANDKELLVDSYSPARLDGLGSIVLDMPAGFSKYRIEFGGLRLRSGTALMTLRNGPSGGALNSGDATYHDVTIQRRGAVTDEASSENNAFVIAGLGVSADQYGEIVVHDQPGQFWVSEAAYSGVDAGGQTILSRRASRYSPGANGSSRWGRIGLLFGGILTSAGYIRIYGVRT